MKGVIFTEFLELVEQSFGEDTVDDMLDSTSLESGGVFTSVGNYPCNDLILMVERLSQITGADPVALQNSFGHWMMKVFVREYPEFFKDKTSALDLLEAVDREIHVEVQKLYPEAELPRFIASRTSADSLELIYQSPRPLKHFCTGLIEASLDVYGEKAEVSACPYSQKDTKFLIKASSAT